MTLPNVSVGHIADAFQLPSGMGIEGQFFRTVKGSWLAGDSRVIVWFDPGSSTGWSVMCIDESAFKDPRAKITNSFVAWSAGEFWGELHEVVDATIEVASRWAFRGASFKGCLFNLGVEDFILRKNIKTREMLDPVRVQAHIEHKAGKRGVPCYRQPSSMMDSVDDQMLKDLDVWDLLPNQRHARDAVRHALVFARRLKAGTV